MKSLTATQKGLLTGVAMILVSIVIFYTKGNFQNSLQYITYSVYVAGIIWTLVEFSKSGNAPNKFGAYFSQGFKCFVVVTLLMVIFTAAFLLLQPQLTTEMAGIVRQDLVKNGNYTPAEIDAKVSMAKKSFLPSLIMGAVFGYLVIGSLVTAIASAFIMQKQKTS